LRKPALVTALAQWAPAALSPGREHALDVRRRVRIPGAGAVDLVTVGQAGDQFVVGLWSIAPGSVGDSDVDAMTRRLHAFDAWYADLVENAEIQGFRPLHRIMVTGNLVGRTVRPGPLVELLSNRGSALRFWTWRRSAGGFEVAPFCGNSRAPASSRSRLKALLPRLTWEDAGEVSEEQEVRDRRRAARPSSRG
jgi:hypothetical protein